MTSAAGTYVDLEYLEHGYIEVQPGSMVGSSFYSCQQANDL